jgi:DNA-binding transcriptional LysR family regulator
MNITFVQLRCFLTLSEALNFSVAAARLHIRQPTLSANIKALEAAVGGQLFDRGTHHVRMTALAMEFEPRAKALILSLDETRAEMRRHLLGLAGSVRVAVLPHLLPGLLLQPMAQMRQTHPNLRIQWIDVPSDEAIELLRQGRVDLAIANVQDDAEDLRCQFLLKRRIVAVMPATHALARNAHVLWSQLRDCDLVVVRTRDLYDSSILQPLRQSGQIPPVAHEVNQVSSALALACAGYAIALMSQHAANFTAREALVAKRVLEPELTGQVAMVSLANRQISASVRLLQDLLLKHIRAKEEPDDRTPEL